jgi:hypothetical protein
MTCSEVGPDFISPDHYAFQRSVPRPECRGGEGAADRSEPTSAQPVIASIDRWGPFAVGIDYAERLARLRSLRAIAQLRTGTRGARLAEELRRAEQDIARLPAVLIEITALAALDRRRVLASFARLHRSSERHP